MENVICGIAKCEEDYIKDWVEWHLNLGFDHIYVYDNSDTEEMSLKNYYNNDRLTYIPLYGDNRPGLQFIAYNDFYANYKFDWCAFIDLDEYIVIPCDIKSFIGTFPADCTSIKLNWHIFGDDDLIIRDMNIPIYKGIVKRKKSHECERNGKQIIKSGLNIDIKSSHWCLGTVAYQADYKINNGKLMEYRNCENAYINHYITKTLNEFLTQKLNRTDVVFKDRKLDMSYFWYINKQTPDKLRYIEQWKKTK